MGLKQQDLRVQQGQLLMRRWYDARIKRIQMLNEAGYVNDFDTKAQLDRFIGIMGEDPKFVPPTIIDLHGNNRDVIRYCRAQLKKWRALVNDFYFAKKAKIEIDYFEAELDYSLFREHYYDAEQTATEVITENIGTLLPC